MKKKPIYAIICAGGKGSRMKSNLPKQFMLIGKEPVLIKTIKAIQKSKLITEFIIPTIDIDFTNKLISKFLPKLKYKAIQGGNNLQESVYKGLLEIQDQDSLVLIHDAARPLVSILSIQSTIKAAIKYKAAIAAIKVYDSVKKSKSSQSRVYIQTSIPRDDLWLALTPQVFDFKLITKAYKHAHKEGFEGTDSASLVQELGHKVELVESEKSNIKITVASDLEFIKSFEIK